MLFFGKGKVNKWVDDLNKRYNALKDSNLDTKMAKLKLISYNNVEYKELYTAIEANYNSLINDYYLDIESSITRLDAIKNTTDVKIFKAEVKSVNDKLDKAFYEQDQIVKQISTMFEQENQIRDELMPLKEKYRDFVSKYSDCKDSLGECVCLFKDALTSLDKNLNQIDECLGAGDYKEARDVLNTFKATLDEYYNHVIEMPQMVNFAFTVLPERYEKVLTMYETMKDEGYILTLIKINPAKEEINALFETIKQAFYELRYMEVKEEIKTLTYKINDIDVLLTTEKEAREDFEENNDRIYAFIDEVNKKFLKAKRDFYSINGVYLIDKSKEDELLFIENELASLSRAKIELNNYIHAPTKSPYSILNNKLVDVTDFSDSINAKVEAFQSYIYSLKDDSNYAYKYVNDASVAVTYYYDLILSLHHQALESTYKDRYEEVASMIDSINKSLTTKPIYVEKINSELKEFKGKVTTLLKDMKESVKLHANASSIIVYTNKYRSSFSAVNEVLNSAQVHFENGEFEFAIDRVSEILQQVHPKAYEDMIKYRTEVNE
ncbi:MAG: hypothetical protein IKJ30_01795 [Bacilli bacterium]|nr:hypothetical protein [Bacilli bacterium]